MSSTGATKKLNRAEIVDQNFRDFVSNYPRVQASVERKKGPNTEQLLALFGSQILSRQMDLMARELRLQNKVFYTIGSSGHEGNAVLGLLTRKTDPAFLHYRSGAFVAQRYLQDPDLDYCTDIANSFAASAMDPSSGGRHKVWGSKPLWILPQTSTIASHLPKAVGTALAIAHGKALKHRLPVPDDSIVICNFGDASANHSTAQGAFNACQWAAHQNLDVPLLFVCEDNGLGISVRTPKDWINRTFSARSSMRYIRCDGLDIENSFAQVKSAVDYCRSTRKPVFLHMRTVRLMGHAGTDFEIDYRTESELAASESKDPLLGTASLVLESGLMSATEVLALYQDARERCFAAAETADGLPKLTSLEAIIRPLAPLDQVAVTTEARRSPDPSLRHKLYGNSRQLPENQPPRHLAVQINRGLSDLMAKYPEMLIFGEDVAQKGGVYTVTKLLRSRFSAKRVFNSLLDEQTILGLAQGYANMGLLPVPEIQYLAYFHNACDQLRGEACSLQFFSNGQYANPMVVRIAGLGYQKGFGGHFHNDNSIAALRDIPGLVVGCPSRGDDAVMMLRTLTALAKVNGRVSVFLEPIALYMTKDLYADGDGKWLTAYPAIDESIALGEARIYDQSATDLLIISYGNGIPMSLRAAKTIGDEISVKVRVMDLRWLQPLNAEEICRQAGQCDAVLIVDEGRKSAGVAEGIFTALIEGMDKLPLVKRVCGSDTYTPLGAAAGLVLPSDESVVEAALELLHR